MNRTSKRTILLASAVVAAAGALTPRSSVAADEETCPGTQGKQCDKWYPCKTWVGGACVEWQKEGVWTYYKDAE
jgi:hypothetical protein